MVNKVAAHKYFMKERTGRANPGLGLKSRCQKRETVRHPDAQVPVQWTTDKGQCPNTKQQMPNTRRGQKYFAANLALARDGSVTNGRREEYDYAYYHEMRKRFNSHQPHCSLAHLKSWHILGIERKTWRSYKNTKRSNNKGNYRWRWRNKSEQWQPHSAAAAAAAVAVAATGGNNNKLEYMAGRHNGVHNNDGVVSEKNHDGEAPEPEQEPTREPGAGAGAGAGAEAEAEARTT
ncbi:GL16983 [Drosophila persimilis]|uniref:GL16983 n=1 Tax=Drosophila persimilis TaxID=7234 RepID=B4GH97_DROPE|nr:GL16983 [Drosophila persimilis]